MRNLSALFLIFIALSGFAQNKSKIANPIPGKILWIYDLEAGLARAQQENKAIMIDFVAEWCAPCKEMNEQAFANANVIRKAQDFIPVRIDIDKQPAVAKRYNALARAYGGSGIPNIVFLSSSGKKLKQVIGYKTARQFLAILNSLHL